MSDTSLADGLLDLRQKIRAGQFTRETSGLMPGLLQCNLVILPEACSDEFLEFCALNPKPCPVIAHSKPGDPTLPTLGKDLDICIDVPEYLVFEQGQAVKQMTDIRSLWREDLVSILLGCSYSFEDALQSEGCSVRNVDEGVNVSMYNSNIPATPTPRFSGNLVVSMRPFREEQIEKVLDITGRFPLAHGAPLHVGDPAAIGIEDLSKPDYGDAVRVEADEVPLFWGCGVTSQRILRQADLPFMITHAPGKMLVTDITYEALEVI